MALFEVREVFRISRDPSLVFAGNILEGTITPGMRIIIELQPKLTCSCEVVAIDYVDRPSVKDHLVALRCLEHDPNEAAAYSELLHPGTVVEVADRPDA